MGRPRPARTIFPEYTPAERQIDAALHAVGFGGALLAAAVLLHIAVLRGEASEIISATVYGAGLVAMFGTSAAYNLLRRPDWKEIGRRCDHSAIFVMIAGTYTPFALVDLGGDRGHDLIVLVWTVAIGGVAIKLFRPRRFERMSLVLYLMLGWSGLLAAGPFLSALPSSTLALLGSGGLLYTVGVVFHLWARLPYHNAIWHGFVLAGAGAHYLAVLDTIATA